MFNRPRLFTLGYYPKMLSLALVQLNDNVNYAAKNLGYTVSEKIEKGLTKKNKKDDFAADINMDVKSESLDAVNKLANAHKDEPQPTEEDRQKEIAVAKDKLLGPDFTGIENVKINTIDNGAPIKVVIPTNPAINQQPMMTSEIVDKDGNVRKVSIDPNTGKTLYDLKPEDVVDKMVSNLKG